MAIEKPAQPERVSKLNFKLELNCACKPPICEHAGPGIAKLLQAAYAKGRADAASALGAQRGARREPTARSPKRSN